MKPTILFPVFQKAAFVERGLRSCLEQTEPSQILIFGPPSTDGTDEIIGRVLGVPVKLYGDARILQGHSIAWTRAENHGFAGMNAGMNLDFNYIQQFIGGDFCLFTSADDVMAPNRVERVKWAFETYNPSWVINEQILKREPDEHYGECPGIEGSGFVDMTQAIVHQIGSSGGFAWATDLYRKYAPINHVESNDVILPALALLERGMYYLDEPLQTMYLHDDLNNLGLEGQVRGATSPDHAAQLEETMAFQGLSNWTSILSRMQKHHPGRPLPPEFVNALYEKIFAYSTFWTDKRAHLTMNKIKPLGFGAKALGMME